MAQDVQKQILNSLIELRNTFKEELTHFEVRIKPSG
jgi:hypothetical protein